MIELLASFSISYNDKVISVLPTENEIITSMSLAQKEHVGELPENSEIISYSSLPSAPYPIMGGGDATVLKNMGVKIHKIGRQ